MIRLQIGMIIGGIALIVFGGSKALVSVKNSSPTQVSYAEYCEGATDAEWLVLDGCYIDYRLSCAIEQREEKTNRLRGTEYYVALQSSTDEVEAIKAWLVVEDSAKISLMEEYWNVPEEEDDAWFDRNAERVIEDNVSIQGLARSGFDLSSEDQRLLKSTGLPMVDDFAIIEKDKEPAGGVGFAMVFGGLLLIGGGGAWMVAGARARRQHPQQPPYPHPHRPVASPPVQGGPPPGAGLPPGGAS